MATYASAKLLVDHSAEVSGQKYGTGVPTATLISKYVSRGYDAAGDTGNPSAWITMVSSEFVDWPAQYPGVVWSQPVQYFYYVVR